MKISKKKYFGLLLYAAVLNEIFFLFYLIFGGGEKSIPIYIIVYFESFLIFLAGYFILKYLKCIDDQTSESSSNKFLLWFAQLIDFKEKDFTSLKIVLIILFSGLVFRITFISTEPSTSNDVYRYLWEGKVIANGYNPYVLSPDNSSLKSLQDNVYHKVTYKNIPAIYPPASQVVFTISHFVFGESLIGLKIIYLVFELITMIFLLKLLLLKKKKLYLLFLYAWLPLPIMEYFINAHLDVIGLTFFIMYLFYLEKENIWISSITFALAFLSKLFPIILIPLIVKKLGIKKSIFFTGIFFLVSLIFYIPFIYNDFHILTALTNYLSNWEFNGSVYQILKIFIINTKTVHIICGILLITSILIISFKYKNFLNAAIGVMICFFAFSSTLYPWYLGWLAVLNPFVEFYSVLSLLFTINFSNFTPLAAVWHEYRWVLIVEYVPFYLLLLWDLFENKIIFRKSNFLKD